jgi:uncharacterized membrane protein HdeD (DUF308 family)
MATLGAASWWALALRGIAAMGLGVATLLLPGVTLATIVPLFGGYAIVDGFLSIVAAFRGSRHGRPWWALALDGVVSLAAGVLTLLLPAIATVALVYVVAAWALLTGALRLAGAIRLRREIEGEWGLVLGGVVALAFGTLLMLAPGAGALAIVLWIGAYALCFGVSQLVFALSVRSSGARDADEPPATLRRAA